MVTTLYLQEQIKTVENNFISKEKAEHLFYISSVELAKNIYQYKVLPPNKKADIRMKFHYFMSDNAKASVGPKSVKNQMDKLFEDIQDKMVCNADKVY